jgi:hypothetical protein
MKPARVVQKGALHRDYEREGDYDQRVIAIWQPTATIAHGTPIHAIRIWMRRRLTS